jgi:hypothetical protein
MPQADALVQPDALGHELDPALRPIDAHVPIDNYVLAIFQLKAQSNTIIPEQDARYLRVAILEGEIPVAGTVMNIVGELAACPEVVQPRIVLQAISNPLVQVSNCEYLGQDVIYLDGLII